MWVPLLMHVAQNLGTPWASLSSLKQQGSSPFSLQNSVLSQSMERNGHAMFTRGRNMIALSEFIILAFDKSDKLYKKNIAKIH